MSAIVDMGTGNLPHAQDWLKVRLANGPVLQRDIEADAEKADISEFTLRAAKKALGVKAGKTSFNAPWHWELPDTRKSDESNKINEDALF